MTQEKLDKMVEYYRDGVKIMREVKEMWKFMTERDKDRAIRDLWDKGIKINREKDFYDTFIQNNMDELEFLDEVDERIEAWETAANHLENSNPKNWLNGNKIPIINFDDDIL